MPTPEVQQYINQQRAAGIADAQIRQTLTAQGWQQADLDQALGVAPQAPIKTPMPGWAKTLIIVLILLFVLPLLIWGGIAGYGYYKYRQIKSVLPPGVADNLYQPPSSSNNSVGIQSLQKLCGNWPQIKSDIDYVSISKAISTENLSNEANGMAVFPQSIKLIDRNTQGSTIRLLVVCAKSTSVSAVANYYEGLGGYTVGDIASLPAGYSQNLGSLKPIKIIDNSKGVLYVYDAGNNDSLLFYTHH